MNDEAVRFPLSYFPKGLHPLTKSGARDPFPLVRLRFRLAVARAPQSYNESYSQQKTFTYEPDAV